MHLLKSQGQKQSKSKFFNKRLNVTKNKWRRSDLPTRLKNWFVAIASSTRSPPVVIKVIMCSSSRPKSRSRDQLKDPIGIKALPMCIRCHIRATWEALLISVSTSSSSLQFTAIIDLLIIIINLPLKCLSIYHHHRRHSSFNLGK